MYLYIHIYFFLIIKKFSHRTGSISSDGKDNVLSSLTNGYTGKIFGNGDGLDRLILPGRCTNFFSPLSSSRTPASARPPRDTISFYLLDPLHDPRLLRRPLLLDFVYIQGLCRPRGDQRQIKHASREGNVCTWTGRTTSGYRG